MYGLSSLTAVACCLIVASTLSRGYAWRRHYFAANRKLDNKVVIGDAVMTYPDVTKVTCALQCASMFTCGFFIFNKAERVCVLCRPLFGNTSFTDASGYRLFTVTEDPADPSYDQPNICPSGTEDPPRGCWKQIAGSLRLVSVGPAGVWSLDSGSLIKYRQGTYQTADASGNSWPGIQGTLAQLDVGFDNLWGVNNAKRIYHRLGITSSRPKGSKWKQMDSGFVWVSVSPRGSVWAVNVSGQLCHRRDSSNALPTGTAWDVMANDMQRVDAGQAGVWALDNDGLLHYRHGTYGDDGSTGTEWRAVEGRFSSVSSGRDLVVAVNSAGQVWLRTGLGPDTPAGLAWLRLAGKMRQVDIYQSGTVVALWGVDFNDQIYFSTLPD